MLAPLKGMKLAARGADFADDAARAVSKVDDAFMAGSRRGGALYGDAKLAKLENYLAKRGVTLEKNADAFLDARNANGAFRSMGDGTAKMYLRSNATRYEVLHELSHFNHLRSVGPTAYQAAGRVAKEQFVYNALKSNRAWSTFAQTERDHAFMYILKVGGNPFAP